jgi:hypothetical protein
LLSRANNLFSYAIDARDEPLPDRLRVNSGLARAKAKGVKLGRGHKKDGERTADETHGKAHPAKGRA